MAIPPHSRSLPNFGFFILSLLVLGFSESVCAQTGTNVALATNGAVATASSTYTDTTYIYPASAVNNGDRKGMNWGTGGGWNDGTSNSFPDWVQIDFSGSQTINEIDLFTVQDN